jgi:hypothetical protein
MPQPVSAKTSFGAICRVKIEDSGRTLKEVATKIPKMPASQFTRWQKGLWTYIEPEKIVQIVEAITDDPREQCDMIVAFLHDMTPIKFRPMLLHTQKGETPFSITDGKAPWSDPMRRRLDVLAEAYELNADLAAMTDQLVAWAKRVKKENGAT